MAGLNRLYPHLLPDDIALWQRFLSHPDCNYITLEYDVRVGRGRDPGPPMEHKYRQVGIGLTQRRIDVVGHRLTSIDIIEITTRAGMKALGQLQVYPILYKETYHPRKTLRTVLITEQFSSDVEQAYLENGVIVYVLPR